MKRIKKAGTVINGNLFQRHFPWRENNDFQLLVDGGEIFPAMLASIRAAQSQIFLEMYLVESGSLLDQFIVCLIDAVQRDVNVYVLFDGYGARGLNNKDRQRIIQAGIHLAVYNPLRLGKIRRNLLRDHRKLLVVDTAQAFVGGMGLTDAFDVEVNPQTFWHDAAVCIEGPVVADWSAAFCRNWRYWARQRVLPVEGMTADVEGVSAGQAGRVVGGRHFAALSIHHVFS